MALDSARVDLGTPCPDFRLPSTDGRAVARDDFRDAPVFGVFFLCNHCPYVQAIEERLVALDRDYRDKGFRFVGICSNDAESYPEDSLDAMRDRAKARGYGFPYLRDEDQSVARAFGAVCTPDLFVYDRDRRLGYHGRLDDSPMDPGKVKVRELCAAVDALLAGGRPAADQRPSIGCSMKWKRGR